MLSFRYLNREVCELKQDKRYSGLCKEKENDLSGGCDNKYLTFTDRRWSVALSFCYPKEVAPPNPDLPFILVVDGNSLSPGSLLHLIW